MAKHAWIRFGGLGATAALLGLLWLMSAYAEAERAPAAPYGNESADNETTSSTWWVGGSNTHCDRTNLQQAINDAASGDIILVARDGNYAGQGFEIWNKSLTIRGGYDTCQSDPASPSGRTVLNATGANRPVIDFLSESTIANRSLVLQNLVITGGSAYPFLDAGGGIIVEGPTNRVSLVLLNTSVRNNQAPSGGGVWLRSRGNGADVNFWLDMDAASEIRNNQATAGSGGGLLCSAQEGSTAWGIVRITGGRISENTASGDGGGLHLRGCTTVVIRPKREGLNDGIWGNQAGTRGGGIFASEGARVTLAGYGGNPVADPGPRIAGEIFSNEATTGGAVAAIDENTEVVLSNVVTHSNTASFGGAVASLFGARVVVRRSAQDETDCEWPAKVPLILPGKPPCSRVIGNHASDRGGAFLVNSAQLEIDRTFVVSNTADGFGGAINAERTEPLPSEPDISVTSSVFSENSGNGIFRLFNSELLMLWSTVAGNQPLPFTAIMSSVASGDRTSIVDVRGSILWEPGEVLVARVPIDSQSNALSNAECVIGSTAADSVDFGGLQHYSQINPGFRDPDASDFRLALDSPAIDYCYNLSPADVPDLAGRPRGIEYDMQTEAASDPAGGLFDLGAWEQPRVRIFQDRFEPD